MSNELQYNAALRDALRLLIDRQALVLVSIQSVEEARSLAQAVRLDTQTAIQVRLHPTRSCQDKWTLFPSPNSIALVYPISDYEAIMLCADSISKAQCISEQPMVIKNTQTSLKTILNTLVQALETLSVNTPNGPSVGLGPASSQQITQVKNLINQLLAE